MTKGLFGKGEKTLGELSLSSLKLRLFLFKDSAPVTEGKKETEEVRKVKPTLPVCVQHTAFSNSTTTGG